MGGIRRCSLVRGGVSLGLRFHRPTFPVHFLSAWCHVSKSKLPEPAPAPCLPVSYHAACRESSGLTHGSPRLDTCLSIALVVVSHQSNRQVSRCPATPTQLSRGWHGRQVLTTTQDILKGTMRAVTGSPAPCFQPLSLTSCSSVDRPCPRLLTPGENPP